MAADLARSIKRTLEVLEYFDEEHPSTSVTEISRELGYPQSSTSILLKSLMTLGYLTYDEKTRAYRPTARVGLIGRSIRPYLFGDGNLMGALEEVSDKTGELIFLATRVGLSIHYIHVIPARNPLRMHLRAGAVRMAAGSPTGYLFLASLPDEEVAVLVERTRNLPGAGESIDLDHVMKELRKIRRQGYVLSDKTVTPGGGVLAMLLPHELEGQQLALCLGGVGTVVLSNEDRFAEIIRAAIARHIPSNREQLA